MRKSAVLSVSVCLAVSSLASPSVKEQGAAGNEPAAQQARRTITGTVTDPKGEPIIGANIVEKGSGNGTISDLDGKFSLSVAGDAVLQVSYIGYLAQEIAVGNQPRLTVTLREDTQALEEVVVTALGIKREEKALGYAVQTIKSEALTAVKGVEVATSMTGKVAGLTIFNTTDFQGGNGGTEADHNTQLKLRGEDALLVIDGFPTVNITLRDIAADDIETITVLKGPTASALYGSRGANGAIMITTKRGTQQEGLKVSINSNEMFNAGFLAIPKQQTSYSAGEHGIYNVYDYVWGAKLDIGDTAPQYNPYTYEIEEMPLVSKGKNNFKNFMVPSYTTNNNVSVSYTGKQGSFRTSLNHIHQKHYYPWQYANRFNFSVAGDLHVGRFALDASMNYTKNLSPNILSIGNSQTSPLYTMLVWMGADWDVMEFRDYWKKGMEGLETNMSASYYNNPWFVQKENTRSRNEGRYNAQVNATYEITGWLKAIGKVGADEYNNNEEFIGPYAYKRGQANGTNRITNGEYRINNASGSSINLEGMLMADKAFKDFRADGFFGASLYYREYRTLNARTANGKQLLVPEWYSLLASDGAVLTDNGLWQEQRNALFGKVGLSWKSAVFVDVTGRNDWASTLDASERSYFYPSVSGSLVLTEFIPPIDWLTFWKIRGSWAQNKLPAGIFDIVPSYSINMDVWNGTKGASYPTQIYPKGLKPKTTEGWEIGSAASFLNSRVRVDIAYFQKLYYNNQIAAALSGASGFTSALVNTEEEYLRKGVELTLSGDVISNKDFLWTATFNWSKSALTYAKLDPIYSSKNYWVAVGEPVNLVSGADWKYRPETGELILQNGMPVAAQYNTNFQKDPDWEWGFIHELKYRDWHLNVHFDGRVGGHAFAFNEQNMWKNGTHIDSDNADRYAEVMAIRHNRLYPNELAQETRLFVAKGVTVVSGQETYDTSGKIETDNRVYETNTVAVSYEAYARSYYPRYAVNVLDATFLKLREVSLGYTLPAKFLQKTKLDKAQISFVAQNLFLWAKELRFEDPDISPDNMNSFPSPSQRLIGFNVQLNF